MEDPSFVTLSTGGMQPDQSQSDSSVSDGSLSDSSSHLYSSSASSISLPTHDTSRTKFHMRDLATFAKVLENSATSIFPNRGRTRYKEVVVLLLRWTEDGMGVQYELDDLAKVFRDLYGFKTETWLIPTAESHFALMGKCYQIVQDFGKADNLLMVYYAGHGLMSPSRQPLWSCTSDPRYATVQWYAIQTLFEQAKSDSLLLLDCCAAASSGPDGLSDSVTEVIAACGFETWAPQPGRHSFTNTLIAVLEEWHSRRGFTAAILHCEVLNRLRHEKPERRGNMKKFECRRTPVHIVSTNNMRAGSIELASQIGSSILSTAAQTSVDVSPEPGQESQRRKKRKLEEADSLLEDNDRYAAESLAKVLPEGKTLHPHVLISVALEEEQFLDVDECRKWLQQFPALAIYAKVQGVYRSNSTLLILSIPVVVWNWIPENLACAFIGFVHSTNLLESSVASSSSGKTITSELPPKTAEILADEAELNRLRQEQRELQLGIPSLLPCSSSDPLTPIGNAGSAMMMSREPSTFVPRPQPRLWSQDGFLKPTYQRPKFARIYCKQCSDHPDGFRGEHELRRHEDRVHKKTIKKWVCITPPSDSEPLIKPAVPLTKCKACHLQKKQYGAYYNAATHLRRAHFRPTTKSRSKSVNNDDPKRGGKAGGNWPTMEDLKPWMMEVEVATEEREAPSAAPNSETDESEDTEGFQPFYKSNNASYSNALGAMSSISKDPMQLQFGSQSTFPTLPRSLLVAGYGGYAESGLGEYYDGNLNDTATFDSGYGGSTRALSSTGTEWSGSGLSRRR